ncbi:MAG: hypothetical protein QXL15_00015 [Candidatus Korarchaeota archaeon]
MTNRKKILGIIILLCIGALLWTPSYSKEVDLPSLLKVNPPPSLATVYDRDLHDWSLNELVTLDKFNDSEKGDLLALYIGRKIDGVILRVDVLNFDDCDIIFLLDYSTQKHYYSILRGYSQADTIIVISRNHAYMETDGIRHQVPFTVDSFGVEVEVQLSPQFINSLSIAAITLSREGRILDTVPDYGLPARVTGTAKIAFVHHGNQPIRGTDWNGKIGWIGGMIYDPMGVWDHDNGIPDGYFYSLYNHERYNVPMNLELTLSLVVSLQYCERYFNDSIVAGFLDRIRADVKSGLIEIMATVHSQQKLPFYPQEVNEWAINISYDLVKQIIDPDGTLGVNPRVAWVPDRTWTNTSNVVIPMARRVNAVVLDDVALRDFAGSGANPWKIWEIAPLSGGGYSGGLKAFFIDSNFRDRIFDPGYLIGYFSALANSPDRQQVCVYGDDWEKSAGNGFFDNKQDYASMYAETLRQLSAIPWIQPVKLSDILDQGWSVAGQVNIRNATAPYIDPNGWSDGINEYFNWFRDWAAFVPDNINPHYHLTPYSLGTIMNWSITKIFNTTALGTYPGNLHPDILLLARHVFALTQHETAFGGINAWGQPEPLYDWQKRQSEHARHIGIYRLAAEWAYNQTMGTPASSTVVYRSDIDFDDEVETVMYNNKLFAVFEDRGGRLVYLFAIQHNRVVSLIGNGYGFYDGVDYHRCDVESGWGDYNDYLHIAALTDSPVSVVEDTLPFDPDNNYYPTPRSNYDRQRYDNRTYSVSTGSNYVQFSYGPITSKVITLAYNSYSLQVSYTTTSQVYINNGFTPDALDLFLHGCSINISSNNTSYLIENVYAPARVGIVWSSGITVTNYTRNFFQETVEIRGGPGSFTFNISADLPSPIQIQNIRVTDTAAGIYFTVNATILSLSGASISSAVLFYVVNNTVYNTTMTHIGSNIWSGTATENIPISESITFWIFANDTTGNWRRSLNYSVSLGSPPYPSVSLDGMINSEEGYGLISTDPIGDAVAGPDWSLLYVTWDAQKLYFAVRDASTEDHTSWTAYLWIAIDMRSGGATSLSGWRSNIQFSGSHLPDFYARIQLKGEDGGSSIWDGSAWTGSTSAVFVSSRYYGDYSIYELSIDWSGMSLSTADSTFYVMLGVAGSYGGDSSVDTIPYDPASNNSANEWTDIDVFDTGNFVPFTWDSDGNKVPDPSPISISWTSPKEKVTVSGTVAISFSFIAMQKVMNVSLYIDSNSTPSASISVNSYGGSKTLYWDSTVVPNGAHILRLTFGLENGSLYNISRMVYVSNTILVYVTGYLLTPSKTTFYENESDVLIFRVNASSIYGELNLTLSLYINRIFYVPNVERPFNNTYVIPVVVINGTATLEIPNYGPGMYYVYVGISESGYAFEGNPLLIEFEILDVVPEPDYTLSIITVSLSIVGFISALGIWSWLQYRKEVYPQ